MSSISSITWNINISISVFTVFPSYAWSDFLMTECSPHIYTQYVNFMHTHSRQEKISLVSDVIVQSAHCPLLMR